jgi:glycosyltransferase involved in cell wall biosynthesis
VPERAISVVVPTRNRAHLLKDCLPTLRAALRPQDELIVADSASTTRAVRDVAREFGATYVRCDEPGTSRARNAGWRAARSDIVAFIDDDVRVDPSWAQALANAFTDPGTTFVTGYIGEPPEEGAGAPAVAQMVATEPARLDATTTGLIGHSANLAVRKQALELIGGFDEMLGPGVRFKAAEDLDLFDRLFGAGYIGRYEPSASANHTSWRRIREYVKLQGAYGYGAGARLSKLVRMDKANRGRAIRTAFLDWALLPLLRNLRNRNRTGIAARSMRLVGTASGFTLGMLYPVRDGHLGGRKYHARPGT